MAGRVAIAFDLSSFAFIACDTYVSVSLRFALTAFRGIVVIVTFPLRCRSRLGLRSIDNIIVWTIVILMGILTVHSFDG